MESTASRQEVIKPVMLKAGVPVALSVAGFIYAWFAARKSLSKASSLSENEANSPETSSQQQGIKREESFHSIASVVDEEPATPVDASVLAGSSEIHDNPCLEQEIIALRTRIEGLQMRELALLLQFDRYCDLKEKESVLGEIKNTLSVEIARVEFLDREISSMETENKRLENFLVQYLRIIERLEYWKSENRMLQRKVQRLMRKSRAQFRLAKEQNLKIKAEEAENLRNRDALQKRIDVIKKSEDEITELHRVLEQLNHEKNELLKKLDTAEKSYASKIEAGYVSREDYNQLLNELEQVKKERAAEAKELIYLRWTNACLRHELMKHNEQQQQQQQNQGRDNVEQEFGASGGVMHYDSDNELHDSLLEHHNEPSFGAAHQSDNACSKRQNLLKRLKRWVEGSEKVRVKPEEKDRLDEINCHGRHSVSFEADEPRVPARRSCSSF